MPPLLGAWAGPARVPGLPVHPDVLHGLVGRGRLSLNVQEGVPVSPPTGIRQSNSGALENLSGVQSRGK